MPIAIGANARRFAGEYSDSTLSRSTGAAATESSQPAAVAGTNDQFSIPAATTSQSPPEQNPLRQATQPTADQPTASADPYSSVYGQNPTTPQATAPVEPAFAASWPEIQSALDQGKLPQAHELLSKWHGDPSLTPAEAEKVESLLGQLAGTVVYSTEHQLEPARVVKPGETLETIAKEYNVPWQLLAKINGIPAPDRLQPGQELKVVRGPFSAVIDLDRKQLTLMLGDRYAGTFQVTMPGGSAVNEGQWMVEGKPESGATDVSLWCGPSHGTSCWVASACAKSADATGIGSAVPLMIGSRPGLDPDSQRANCRRASSREPCLISPFRPPTPKNWPIFFRSVRGSSFAAEKRRLSLARGQL